MDTAITPFESKFAPILENISKHSLEIENEVRYAQYDGKYDILHSGELSAESSSRPEDRKPAAKQFSSHAARLPCIKTAKRGNTVVGTTGQLCGFKQSSRAEGSRQLPLDTSQAGISELDRED
jgi:hypothetical protein